MTLDCKHCSTKFEGASALKLYCSNKCRNQAKKKPRECVSCGSIFMSKNKHSKFCGSRCAAQYRERGSTGTYECETCGKTFTREKSRERSDRSFCSRECAQKAGLRYNSKTLSCTQCLTKFTRQPSSIREGNNFCTHECYARWLTETGVNAGANNTRYNPDLTGKDRAEQRLNPEYAEWRLAVYRRDNFKCRKCGTGSKGRKYLNAHHILNYSQHHELRTDVSNGITLCRPCHIEFHRTYGKRDNTREQIKEFLDVG